MEEFEKLTTEAYKSLQTADHLLYTTYPMVHDVKLLIKISEHTYMAMVLAMEGLLAYDYAYKRITSYKDDFNTKLDVFKLKSEPRYGIGRSYLLPLLELREFLQQYKKSIMAFARKESYVVYGENYKQMRGISLEKAKENLFTAKQFVEKIGRVTLNNARLSGR